MDREKIIRHLNELYVSKRGMASRVPLGVQPDALWEELLDRRRSVCTMLPLHDGKGARYWYVTTDKMIRASEKIVGTLYENETEFDPYTDAPPVSTLEEVFYTSYVDGAQITMKEAMDFLAGGQMPGDIEEQMVANNRMAGSFATANLWHRIDEGLLQELVGILTDGMEGGGKEYRTEEVLDFVSPDGEQFAFPPPETIPGHMQELCRFLASPQEHPLIKAAAAQAFLTAVRPFPEGNGRLGRLVSSMILIRAGYTFFGEVSLSALTARKSYGYYEACANILRDENGGDLTYFMEYYIELLSRAVDERRIRLQQRQQQEQKAETEMARMTLGKAQEDKGSVFPGMTRDGPGQQESTPVSAQTAETAGSEPADVNESEAAFQESSEQEIVDGPEDVTERDPSESPPEPAPEENSSGEDRTQPPGAPPGEDPDGSDSGRRKIEILRTYAETPDRMTGRLAALVLSDINTGNVVNRIYDCTGLTEEMQANSHSLGCCFKILKQEGILVEKYKEKQHRFYVVSPDILQAKGLYQEMESLPEAEKGNTGITEEHSTYGVIEKMMQSNSQKDRRIAAALLEHMDTGEITEEDYARHDFSGRWKADMRLAEQMGLVEMISPDRYAILNEVKDSRPDLDRYQRRFMKSMYDAFGENPFSVQMLVATLDYSGSYASAVLHQFTLMRLVDCQREDVNRYQLLVSPREAPEYFDVAS